MQEDLATQRRRILLNLDIINVINDHLGKIDDGDKPLEKIHGTLTLEIVKGQFHRIIPAPSYLLDEEKPKRRRNIA